MGSDGGIATERCQLGDLILQQKLVVAAAVQQGGFGTGGKGGVILPCPSAGHLLQGGAAGFSDLYTVAQFFACGDELLLPLARLDFAVFFFQQAGQHKDGVLGIGKGIAELLQIFIRIGRRTNERQNNQPAAAKERDGARRQHNILHTGGGAVQRGTAFPMYLPLRCSFTRSASVVVSGASSLKNFSALAAALRTRASSLA